MKEFLKDRIILHVDLDAFYAQVEQVRLGLSKDVPLVVCQWSGILAVSYSARKFGIKRHSTVEEAVKACPDLKCVHVATYKNGESVPRYHDNPLYNSHKVSLDVYRRASKSIFQIFKRYSQTFQRASVDEAYMDVTEEVNNAILQSKNIKLDPERQLPIVEWDESDGVMVGDACKQSMGWSDLQLKFGALLSKEIRHAVISELKYTCSTGISINKPLAKLCSQMNKPDNQTILRSSQILPFMNTLRFDKIQKLGGKLGKLIHVETRVETAGELWAYSEQQLEKKFGDSKGKWLYDIIRGICNDPVKENDTAKSMGACKNFRPPLKKVEELNNWIKVLSSELFDRLQDDYEINKRWPRTISLNCNHVSKSTKFQPSNQIKTYEKIYEKAWSLFGASSLKDANSFSNVSMHFSNFELEEQGVSSIRSFLVPSSSTDSISNVMVFEKKTSEKKNSSSLFSIDGDDVVDDEEFKFKCEKCLKMIHLQNQDEHADYHFALELQKEGRREITLEHPKKKAKPSSASSSSKNKNNGKGKEKEKNQLLTNFFLRDDK